MAKRRAAPANRVLACDGHERHVRVKEAAELHRLVSVEGLANDINIGLGGHQPAQQVPIPSVFAHHKNPACAPRPLRPCHAKPLAAMLHRSNAEETPLRVSYDKSGEVGRPDRTIRPLVEDRTSPVGAGNGLGACLEPELAQEIVDVELHGVFGKEERASDLAV